ncbi:c-type cytochrome [Sphingosinicella terrae]|uniref:c-type cytochrome n=1 Tax=Sphingosinicella terrae TaxID=2172047 RepID=UPI0013B37FCA|nr:c-type cytochrome [Sphingosinicella terrae]
MRLAAALTGAALLAGAACGASPSTGAPDGATLYRRHCYACHALEPGRDTPAGPTLHDIFGRAVAGRAAFNYSPALRRLAARQPHWTASALDRFLADPQAVAPGNEMGLAGIADERERQALIDWLRER